MHQQPKIKWKLNRLIKIKQLFQIKPLIRDKLSIGEELCTNAMRQNKYTASQN